MAGTRIAIPGVSNGEHVDRPFASLVESRRVRPSPGFASRRQACEGTVPSALSKTGQNLSGSEISRDAGAAQTEYPRKSDNI